MPSSSITSAFIGSSTGNDLASSSAVSVARGIVLCVGLL